MTDDIISVATAVTSISQITAVIQANSCGDCAFWQPLAFRSEEIDNFIFVRTTFVNPTDAIGWCRKQAPLTPYQINPWPFTSTKSWCGDWSKKA